MKKMVLGIDSGSTMCKVALLSNERVIDCAMVPSGWNTKQTAIDVVRKILNHNAVKQNSCYIVSTGYGRENIDFADQSITEITAHAYGGVFLEKNIQGIIDIGGQDSKIIEIRDNRPVHFMMNDKCAAGTGRFLEMACEKLEIPIDTIDDFLQTAQTVSINSMCAVFAESEIIGHLAQSKDRAAILNGVIESIGLRIVSLMGRTTKIPNGKFLMTGGLSQSDKIIQSIERIIDYPLIKHEMSPFAGAIGAAHSVSLLSGQRATH